MLLPAAPSWAVDLGRLLALAVKKGSLACMEILLQAGAPVNAGFLHDAAAGGRAEVLAMLLPAAGAANLGQLLRAAARKGSAKTVQVLLDAGAAVDTASLEAASAGARSKPLQVLLQAARAAGVVGRSAPKLLHAAAAKGRSKNLELLLASGADVNRRDADGSTALFKAVSSAIKVRHHADREAAVSLLLEAGADVNKGEGTGGRTPLMEAAACGEKAAVQLLLEAGADVNHQRADGRTALMDAARSGQEGTVALLLVAGADVNLQRADGRTALLDAASSGKEGSVALLLAAGADVNQQRADGSTALMDAASSGHEGTVALLLVAGADVDLQRADGRTALMMAVSNESQYKYSNEGGEAGVRLLLAAGAAVAAVDMQGKTVLQLALEAYGRHSLPVIRMLLAAGADGASLVAGFKARLHKSAKDGNVDAILELADLARIPELRHLGMDINARDSAGRHCLHLAVLAVRNMSSYYNNLELERLLDAGVSVAAASATHPTPLDTLLSGKMRRILEDGRGGTSAEIIRQVAALNSPGKWAANHMSMWLHALHGKRWSGINIS